MSSRSPDCMSAMDWVRAAFTSAICLAISALTSAVCDGGAARSFNSARLDLMLPRKRSITRRFTASSAITAHLKKSHAATSMRATLSASLALMAMSLARPVTFCRVPA